MQPWNILKPFMSSGVLSDPSMMLPLFNQPAWVLGLSCYTVWSLHWCCSRVVLQVLRVLWLWWIWLGGAGGGRIWGGPPRTQHYMHCTAEPQEFTSRAKSHTSHPTDSEVSWNVLKFSRIFKVSRSVFQDVSGCFSSVASCPYTSRITMMPDFSRF